MQKKYEYFGISLPVSIIGVNFSPLLRSVAPDGQILWNCYTNNHRTPDTRFSLFNIISLLCDVLGYWNDTKDRNLCYRFLL